ncbi:uncharacterized protein LTHEOB_11585 [Lasiodiplodia theobromae]|uniref:uncharacterized protein n=1 Tax=Lasiodiplodia theobromae TaxID=45133 RepID=UPI0015C30CBD|nr:uncharacterized protein LTHEOB_11585 [Lasiodiplodia theobromae]KAF4537207.1 hypothetical protein LTHEOB_11585 [Lasiodiplodia theobromae]
MTETQQPMLDPGHTSTHERASSALRRIFKKHDFWTISNTLAFIYVLASIAFPIALFIPISGQIKGIYDTCSPDGDFDRNAPDLNPLYDYYTYEAGFYYTSFVHLFSIPSLVTITIAFGRYSFAQAKWIDLIWDIGVGRIGQVILVSISSRVITRSMLYAMETHPIPHHLFVGISFQNQASANALWSFLTVTPKHHLWKVWKGRLLVIALIIIYLIAFPTITSAMTGYITTFTTKIKIDDISVDISSPNLGTILFTIGNCSVFGRNGTCHLVEYELTKIAETGEVYGSDTVRALELGK